MLDEDGRPVRGAGAMPYPGSGNGTGDMTGVSFTTNWMEQKPSQSPKGKFMEQWEKMIADVAAGKTEPADINDVVAGKPVDDRKEKLRANLEKARAARKAKAVVRASEVKIPPDPDLSARMKEIWRKRKEKANGTGAVQESAMSERGGGPEDAGEAEVRGADERHGVPEDGVSSVSRAGGDGGAGLPEVQQGTPETAEGIQSQSTLDARTRALFASIGMQPFHITVPTFATMPLEQALHQLDTLRAQTAALSQMLEGRRQNEQPDRQDVCTWCGYVDRRGYSYGHWSFEVNGVGSGQYRMVTTCNKSQCIGKYDLFKQRALDDMASERRGGG